TNIMDEDMNVDIEEEEVEATKVLLTPEIIDLLGKALFFIAKDTKRPALQGVNFVLKDKKLTIISTDTIKMFITHVKTDIEGEFNVILRQEMIPVLLAIHETIGKKAFPVLINGQGLYIVSKGIYFKSVLLEGPFPDITKVVEKVENTKTTYELTFDEKTFKKIKSLENKSTTLVIKKTGKEILFEMKSEIDLNSFKLEAEDDVEFEKKMNYSAFTSVLGMVPKVEFKGDFLIFKQNHTIILLMAMRN
ncbi:MAG: hypothetical protein EOM11_09295, partial [Erysipelotrichia bacterium]|nr:hypothetical protein [Erysipelotrichia bacterium]